MNALIENPIWILLSGIGVVIILVVCFLKTGKRGFALAAGIALALFASLLLVERSMETDRERLRDTIVEMARAVQNNDLDTLSAFVSPSAPDCRNAIRAEMPSYEFKRCQVMKFNMLEFDRAKDPGKAKAVFFVWADLDAPRYGYNGHVRRRVILFFEKQDDKRWLLTDYDHEDPASPSDYLSPNRQEDFQASRY